MIENGQSEKFLSFTTSDLIKANVRALRSAGYLENVSPELKPIKDTKVENIFYCSSVFGQPDMQPIVAQKMRIYSLPPLTQNPLLSEYPTVAINSKEWSIKRAIK